MTVAAAARALAMFDAFLAHARASDAPRVPTGPRPAPPPDALDEDTRVVRMPEAPPGRQPLDWDDRTAESVKPPVLESAEGPTDLSVALPGAPRVEERSIIIDDDSLTQPEMERDAVKTAPAGGGSAALDLLLQEMFVLVKYGHGAQAAGELERWVAANPDDLHGHLRVAEFEMARVDREAALRRYGTLVSLFLDRGDLRSAGDVMRRLRRDMPGDPRVTAIAQWNGLE